MLQNIDIPTLGKSCDPVPLNATKYWYPNSWKVLWPRAFKCYTILISQLLETVLFWSTLSRFPDSSPVGSLCNTSFVNKKLRIDGGKHNFWKQFGNNFVFYILCQNVNKKLELWQCWLHLSNYCTVCPSMMCEIAENQRKTKYFQIIQHIF